MGQCQGLELYQTDADCFSCHPDDCIFLSVCEDREREIVARGREEWKSHLYSLTFQEFDSWFKNVFFIQWCHLRSLQKMFNKADKAIKRDRTITYLKILENTLFLTIFHVVCKLVSFS